MTHEAASALRDAREALVDAVSAEEQRAWPERWARFGPTGQRRCREDARFHLGVLAAAVDLDEPAVFADYVTWARRLLAARGIDPAHLDAHLDLLRRLVDAALPPGAAAEVARAIAPAAAGDEAPLAALPAGPEADAFLDACLAGDGPRAQALARAALDARGPAALYEQVVRPALYEVGERWLRGELSEPGEHLATATAQVAIAALYSALPWPAPGPAALVCCVGGERHDLGARLLSDLLALDGWRSSFLGADTPARGLGDLARRQGAVVVALSATLPTHLGDLLGAVRAVREEHPAARVLVGGQALRAVPDPAARLGADGWAASAAEAVALARAWKP
ncbi:MAG: cobalamin-dependent protein [Planctomycetes bacterium]|nr:cobalamin-dependent protein [Planctomycetota bacterium]